MSEWFWLGYFVVAATLFVSWATFKMVAKLPDEIGELSAQIREVQSAIQELRSTVVELKYK